MGNGIGVPALCQHRNRHNAADRIAKASFLAHRVHDFPQQILIGQVFGLAAVAGALDDFTAETFDLIRSHFPEVFVQGVAGLQLFAVDEQCPRAAELVAMFIEIAEQRKPSVFKACGTVFILTKEAGNKIVNQLGYGGILTDDNEARRHANTAFFP